MDALAAQRLAIAKLAEENGALRQRLEAAENAWAEFKEHYPWTIQPWDDMQMAPEAVVALERLAAALAGEE